MNCLLPAWLILLNIDANLSAVSFVRSGSRRPCHLSVWLLSCCLIIDNQIEFYYYADLMLNAAHFTASGQPSIYNIIYQYYITINLDNISLG